MNWSLQVGRSRHVVAAAALRWVRAGIVGCVLSGWAADTASTGQAPEASAPPTSSVRQALSSLPSHPRLLFRQQDIPAIQARIAQQAWARAHFAALRREAEQWLNRSIELPPRGGQWYHWYSCPKHGARLRTEGATRHVCPVDGEVFSGPPYDDVVVMTQHNQFAAGLRTLGLVYQLTRDSRYAAQARAILLAYAARYTNYPLHTIRGEAKVGGGRVGPQTLDESTWLITVVQGADCIWDTLSAAQQRVVTESLLRPATEVIRQHRMGIHNIQCWKNAAVGLTGLLLGDSQLVEEALHGPAGYHAQLAQGVLAEGTWFEGAWGYHFYTLSALRHLTEAAWHCGIDLYNPTLKRMFDAPLAMAMPDLHLPAFNDSHPVWIPAHASLYETALARYRDPQYGLVVARSNRRSDPALLHGVTDLPAAPDRTPASRNFPGAGLAVLAAGQGTNATWFCLDYGPHGGGHGHPDKLGFVLYGFGRVLAPDPGTANYGVPIQAGWFRTTLAHNTLTVDEESQQPAQGQCDGFVAGDGFSAVLAQAGPIYKGVQFRRAAALIGPQVLVGIDLVRADRPRQFDLAYHNHGRLRGPGQPLDKVSDRPGYSYLRALRRFDTPDGLTLKFELGQGLQVTWTMAAGPNTTYFTGTGVGAHTEDRVPLVIARRKAQQTTFAWAVGLGLAPDELQIEAADKWVNLEAGSSNAEFGAVQVRTPTSRYLLVVNPAGVQVRVGSTATQARLACYVPDPVSGWRLWQATEP